MLSFVIFLVIVLVLAFLGIYHTAQYWLPGILDIHGSINTEAFKAIAAALATAVAALIAAGASILNVGLQLKAGKSLEATKRRLAGELEKDKGRIMRELESYKNKISIEKAEIERKLAWLEEAREIASNYRYAVGLLRQGQHQKAEIEEIQKKVAGVRDSIDPSSGLYRAWSTFFQRGHNLNERAKALKKIRDYRDLWNTVDPNSGVTFGIEFATSADDVLEILRNERLQILEEAARSAQPATEPATE